MAEKLFYRVKEVAEALHENISTIRYWENAFPQITPTFTPKGKRQYSAKDFETFRTIRFLIREQGLTVDGAVARLSQKRDSITLRSDTLERLRAVRTRLVDLRKTLG